MKGKLFKTGISMLLASAMMITSIPASPLSAAEPAEKATPVLDSAIKTYDFNDWNAVTGDDGILSDGSDKNIVLEAFGSCKKPELKENTLRGRVLALREQGTGDNGVANRGDALLPENPFQGKSIDNGLTLNFWTKTTGTVAGNRTLVDFEVAPASKGRAGTLAFSQSMLWWNITDQKSETFTDFNINKLDLQKEKGWKMVTMALTKSGIAFYSNGTKIEHSIQAGTPDYEEILKELVGNSGIFAANSEVKVRLGASMANYWVGAGAWIDDISFFGKALSDSEVKALYDETYVEAPKVSGIEIKGANKVDEGQSIQLVAQVTPEDGDASDISGKTITWQAADTTVVEISDNGKVTGKKAGTTTVTAQVKDTQLKSSPFTVEVMGAQESLEAGKYYLTVYSTTKNFYASASNLDQETRSVYMAVSKDGRKFEVLNNGGGVIYAKEGSRRITSPKVYKNAGKFTVVAEDTDAANGLHIFTSDNGVHYNKEEVEDFYSDNAPVLKKDNFELLLKNDNILTTDTSITLGNAVELTEEEYNYIVNKLGTVVNTGLEKDTFEEVTAEVGDDIEKILSEQYPSVNATYSDGSTQKFNIDWSEGIEAKESELSEAGTVELTGKVVQTKYLNNLKEINNSTLPEDDPENVNPEEPDHYNEATGAVYYDETKFVEGMADPMIYWDEETQYYYMTGSYFPEEQDAMPGEQTEQYDRVVLRRGRTLEELQDRSKQVTIWKVGNQEFQDSNGNTATGHRYIWAPEIHRVGDHWVVYFTESHSSLFDIYCHALVLPGDQDPYETALSEPQEASKWTDYKMRSTRDKDPFGTSFCLDMTYFKDPVNNKSYVIWPGKPSIGNTDMYIATVNEAKPWEITSDATCITSPEFGWERVRAVVNEGPTVLQKDGKIFMCYSAAGTGSEYAIGMLTAEQGKDLLDAKNWMKNPYPVLTSRDVDGEEGPGHNSFTVDKDGNAIFVYHARPTSHNYKKCGWNGTSSSYNSEPLNDPCRHARLKRVHWAADGTPILKMTYEDELKDEYKTVKVNVKLSASATSVTLNKETLALKVGESEQLTADVTTDNDANKALTWSSSNEEVASVAADGTVTAKAKGEAVIKVTTANGKIDKCKVTVTAVPVESVTLDKESLDLWVGDESRLEAKIAPDNATNKNVTWSSSNRAVAVVDADGVITAKAKGTVVITVTTVDGGKTDQCEVNVKVPVSSVSLNKETLDLKIGATEKLLAEVNPSNAFNKDVTWSSSNEAVASVTADGTVTAKAAGEAVIKVTTVDGEKTDECKVTVTAVSVESVSLDQTQLSLTVGAAAVLKETIAPAEATNKSVIWSSSNENVASVLNGTVTAKAAGTAVITVTTVDGNKTAFCNVNVQAGSGSAAPTVTSFKLNVKKLTLGVKETYSLTATVVPKGAAKATFVSNKPSIVSVGKTNGKLTAKKTGKAVITATAGSKTAKVTVTVKKAPDKKAKVTLNKKKITLKVKGKSKTFQIKPKVSSKYGSATFKYTVDKKGKKAVKVDKNGKVTAKKKGSASITVKTYNGKAKAVLKVTVK